MKIEKKLKFEFDFQDLPENKEWFEQVIHKSPMFSTFAEIDVYMQILHCISELLNDELTDKRYTYKACQLFGTISLYIEDHNKEIGEYNPSSISIKDNNFVIELEYKKHDDIELESEDDDIMENVEE